MYRYYNVLTTIVFIGLLWSCAPAGSANTDNLTILPSVGVESNWFQRDIEKFEESTTLRILSLSRKSASVFELYIENFASDGDNETFDFVDRYYVEFTVSEGTDRITCRITGIKTQPQENYTNANTEGFEPLIEALGFSSFELSYDPYADVIELEIPDRETLLVFHGSAYTQTSVEELEHEGKLREGSYREYIFYVPMDEEFRLFYRWSFSYRNEEGSSVTLSNSFDAYGYRTYDDSYEGYSCEIESLSNSAYPRIYYTEDKHEIIYNRRIEALGFTRFYERQGTDGKRFLECIIDGEAFSWQIAPTPL